MAHTPHKVGGDICSQMLPPEVLPAEPRPPSEAEIDGLWRVFVAIGETWQNTVHDSAGLRSSWLDFLTQKCVTRPSYIGEYSSALSVFEELDRTHGDAAMDTLFFHSGVNSSTPPTTRLAHAKQYVVDEFIRVQIVIGGFKNFIVPDPPAERPDHIVNHRGFVAGSRYNRVTPVRVAIEQTP